MNRVLEKKYKRIAGVIMLLVLILMSMTPMAASAAGNSVILTVEQTYSASSSQTEETFKYKLEALNQENPMPTSSSLTEYSFTITGSRSAEIGPIKFDREGIYRYLVYQVVDSVKSGYVYDMRVYMIEVYVSESLNAMVVVKNESDVKEDAIGFENRNEYIPPTSPRDRKSVV